VVAKCGVFLKEKGKSSPFTLQRIDLNFVAATDVEGIFRLSGSAKRIKDLQTVFNSPPKYGKGLDWTGYTVHDAANILRRYLNQLPEPIVPLTFYDRFRDPLRSHQAQAAGDEEANANESSTFDHDSAVATYQRLITQLPPLNRQLLLYILDLLAVFSSKSDLNRMTAANLAAIFQPGIISHPSHDMAPSEYRLSQDVLIYLIENQDNFLIGMTGTAVDEKTVKDVESGASTLVSPKTGVGRSASNASAGADSLRKYGVRRNVSVSSRHSRGSGGVPSPGTPTSGVPLAPGSVGGGIARSNTLPSKKSPALNSTRFQRPTDPSTPTSVLLGSPTTTFPKMAGDGAWSQGETPSRSPVEPSPKTRANPAANSVDLTNEGTTSREKQGGADTTNNGVVAPTNQQPAKERKISSLFARSPIMGPIQSTDTTKEPRQPNRLKKKPKIPGSANNSAQSSQNSLHAEPAPAFHTPLASPELNMHARLDPLATSNPVVSNTAPTPVAESQPAVYHAIPESANDASPSQNALKPPRSREASIHSRSSLSDLDATEDPALRAEKAQKRGRRWRFSSSAKKDAEAPLAPPPPIGQNAGARLSTSSVGSSNRPRKSFTGDSQSTQQFGTDANTGYPSVIPFSSQDSAELLKDNPSEPEKKGLFGKWKAKMSQSKEEKRERDMEKERAKSPPRSDAERGGSRNSLSVLAQEHLSHRGRSMDLQREEALPTVSEAVSTPQPTQAQPAPTSQPHENAGG
jgi:GTPase-activating protein SAC7